MGSHTQGFSRLVEEMDRIAPQLNEQVTTQIGFTRFTPRNTQYFKFVDEETMDKLMDEASLIVTHGGAASVMKAVFRGKPTVVVPRLRRFREHIDNHQLELAEALSERGSVITVENIADLKQAIEKARNMRFSTTEPKSELIEVLRSHIARIGKNTDQQ